MPVLLTDEQFESLVEYFEFAFIAMSDEEQNELLLMEKPLRDMLRSLKSGRDEILEDEPGNPDQP